MKDNQTKNNKQFLPKIIVVLGPTAVGKSDLAVDLALKLNGEVISADSRQVYAGLDIGTGKITKKEMKGVPHHLLDVAKPTARKRYTANDFQRDAYIAIDDILTRGKVPIVCGGTGFYIQSLVDGILLPDVSPNPVLRKKLHEKTAPVLVKMLSKLDKKALERIDGNNKYRLIRAIEIAQVLGKVPALVRNPRYDALQIGLDIDDEILKEKVSKRIEVRVKKGMIKEAQRLHADGLSFKRMREFGLEYRHLADLLQKKITKEQFSEGLFIDIWKYVKKQRAWFRRDERIQWFKTTSGDFAKISAMAKKFIKG